MHLITAQEVAGLNPAEVTNNEGVIAPSFLFLGIIWGTDKEYIPPYPFIKVTIIIFCYESIHNKYYKLLYVQHLYVHLNKQIKIFLFGCVGGSNCYEKGNIYLSPLFYFNIQILLLKN